MNKRTVVLVMLEAWGGRIEGRTTLQKRSYFLSQVMGCDLGFRAHYYGPYSADVELAMGELCGLGIVRESVRNWGRMNDEGFEKRRYDYELTEDGKVVVRSMHGRFKEEFQIISQAVEKMKTAGGEMHYMPLAIAAKAYFILSSDYRDLSSLEIVERARKFGWGVSDSQVYCATSFLAKLGLVR